MGPRLFLLLQSPPIYAPDPSPMKHLLESLLASAVATLRADGVLPADFAPVIQFHRTRDKAHGDWATNLALASAKAAGRKPRDIAEAFTAAGFPLNKSEVVMGEGPLRHTGEYDIAVQVHSDILANLKVVVAAE